MSTSRRTVPAMTTDFDTSTGDGRVTFRADTPAGTGWLTVSLPDVDRGVALELLEAALAGELRTKIIGAR